MISVTIALAVASAQDHTHNWLFELKVLIGQYRRLRLLGICTYKSELYALIEKCVYKRAVCGTAHFFRLTST